MNRLEGQWALVTGASSGLGVELAKGLASRSIDLVLAARRTESMQLLAAELTQQHGVQVIVETIDLSVPDAAATLQTRLAAQGIEPDILINNAAFGLSGPFVDQDATRLRAMLQVDIVAMTELTHLFAKSMAVRGRGHVMLVASVAAFQPTPLLAAYGAAKAYVLSFGEALHAELAPQVNVTVLSPGLMETGFLEVADFGITPAMRPTILPVTDVAQMGLDAMFSRKSGIVAGRLNKLMTFGSRLMPRRVLAKMALNFTKV